jgi:hypothetical protein
MKLETIKLTVYSEEGGLADSATCDVLRDTTVVAHVGKTRLGDEEMTVRRDDVVWVTLRVNYLTVTNP